MPWHELLVGTNHLRALALVTAPPRPSRRRGRTQAPRDDDGRDDGRWLRHTAVTALRAIRDHETPRLYEPSGTPSARYSSQAATEVPNPGDDGNEYAPITRRGTAPTWAYRSHLQGRLSLQARPG